MQRILFVCLGNICRSPTAEGVFRHIAQGSGIEADSAGTADWNAGRPPHRRACIAARSRGVDISMLRARQVRAADFLRFDLMVAMDGGNLSELREMRPPSGGARLSLMLDHAPEQPLRDVPDPYFTGDFDGVFDLLETASRGLLAVLAGGRRRP
ncbi:MAG: low molecular weight protein-tyrosine-phosphatase [Paracoccaceae bacterium]